MHQSQQATQGNVGHSERRCRNCDSFVTPDFARVFGNNDDEINLKIRFKVIHSSVDVWELTNLHKHLTTLKACKSAMQNS
ncbi:DUF7563 family protein [Haladaptatus litoreus]